MAQNVLVADLLFPKRNEYVRGSVKKDNVDRMRAAITGRDWPFPPILVRRLDKPEKRRTTLQADFVGFVAGDEFLVGYGLDWAHRFRGLRAES